MTTALARLPMPDHAPVDAEQWRVLTDAIWPAAKTPEAVMLALEYCRARKLDPFRRPVHIVPMYNSVLRREVETVWPGISELQTTAARTGQWAGMDPPEWGPMRRRLFVGMVGRRGEEREMQVTIEYPEWCSVTVYRLISGQRCAFSEPVYWEEAYARIGRSEVPNDTWQKRVRGQLHKVAKAAALRAAFPEEGGGDYTAEEMEGGTIAEGGVVIDAQAEPPPPAATIPKPPLDSGSLRAAQRDYNAPPAKMTAAAFLANLDRELDLAPDADAITALLTSSRVTEARSFMKGDAAERLKAWTAKAEEKHQALRDEAAEAAIPLEPEAAGSLLGAMPDDIAAWPIAGEEMMRA